MAAKKLTPAEMEDYLELAALLRTTAAQVHDDCQRVMGMLRSPTDHGERAVALHMLRSLAGRRKGWDETAVRMSRLLIDCKKMSHELE
jgi:hypothetical protein